jgi:cyclopropane fatty-acyl-phospholipid synthase-like methyltransferase
MDRVFTVCGLTDLTDGMYHGDPSVTYQQAQRNQAEWLLDQAKCSSRSRLLDIGCGYGRLLEAARRRGAKAVGIAVSPRQVVNCRQRGLDARLLDYRELDESWDGAFDCIVANGSIEHFVQPRDAALGWQETTYRQMFQDCHRLLDPTSPSGRMVATVIHFNRVRPEPYDLVKLPFRFPLLSDSFHLALLERVMGGHYPADDQLIQCAAPHFKLVRQLDGTEDYRRTSDEWLRRVRRGFLNLRIAQRLLKRLLPCLLSRPIHTSFAMSLLFTASWQWQFRGVNPPTRLWRLVWQHRNESLPARKGTPNDRRCDVIAGPRSFAFQPFA